MTLASCCFVATTGLSMESYGTLQFQLHTIMRGGRKLGYHLHV